MDAQDATARSTMRRPEALCSIIRTCNWRRWTARSTASSTTSRQTASISLPHNTVQEKALPQKSCGTALEGKRAGTPGADVDRLLTERQRPDSLSLIHISE